MFWAHVVLVSTCLCAVNYTGVNDSFMLNSFKVRNPAHVSLQAPPNVPYQVIEHVNQTSINGYCNFSNNFANNVAHKLNVV